MLTDAGCIEIMTFEFRGLIYRHIPLVQGEACRLILPLDVISQHPPRHIFYPCDAKLVCHLEAD